MSEIYAIPYITVKPINSKLGKITIAVETIRAVYDISEGVQSKAVISFKGVSGEESSLHCGGDSKKVLKAMDEALRKASESSAGGVINIEVS